MPAIAKNLHNKYQSSAATTRHANVDCGSMGQTWAAWKLINIHTINLGHLQRLRATPMWTVAAWVKPGLPGS